jgi:hypothetical protein
LKHNLSCWLSALPDGHLDVEPSGFRSLKSDRSGVMEQDRHRHTVGRGRTTCRFDEPDRKTDRTGDRASYSQQ